MKEMKIKILGALILFALSFVLTPVEAQAAGKKLTLIKSFLTNTGNAREAKPIGEAVKKGAKLYFYYKIGNLQYRAKNGAPYETKMVLKKGGKVIKDYGVEKGNAQKVVPGQPDQILAWYQSAKDSLNVRVNAEQGSYSVDIEYKDVNSGQSVKIVYKFTVK